MRPIKNGIILRVDPDQKERAIVAGCELMVANKYKTNHREKSPVVGIVEVGNNHIKKGTALIVHHNLLFGEISAYSMGDGLFSIPTNHNIFMRIDERGEPHSMFGNIICEYVNYANSQFYNITYHKPYNDRAIVVSNGYGFRKGQLIFHAPMHQYEIVYNWRNVERPILKVLNTDIVAILEK